MSDRYVKSYTPDNFNGLAFVAQSPGKNEVDIGVPLVGASGQLLEQECTKAGIDFQRCWRGNVVGFRPLGNDFGLFCGKKAEVGGKDYPLPPIASGMYLKPEYFPELQRLKQELTALKPNLVVALGREALWALTGLSGINKYRGAIMESNLVPGLKVLPTFHPAGIFRAYGNKLYLTLDLFKAQSEMESPEIKIIEREIHLYPETPKELLQWVHAHRGPEPWLLSVDIEDRTRQGKKVVECIGFAFDPYCALVVPFFSELRPNNNYWRDLDDEIQAWEFVDYMLRTYDLLGQNYAAYDTWVLYKEMGIRSMHLRHDTMIQHHAYMPEMKKGLGLLSSVYCNVPAYKTLKPRGHKQTKRDE